MLVSYPIVDVWPTAVRFLRVDRNFPIREKDDAAGYILFDYADGGRVAKAAFEFIRTSDSRGREATRIVLSIPDQPRHVEQMLIDKLAAKLRDDHGNPLPSPPPKPQHADKDAG